MNSLKHSLLQAATTVNLQWKRDIWMVSLQFVLAFRVIFNLPLWNGKKCRIPCLCANKITVWHFIFFLVPRGPEVIQTALKFHKSVTSRKLFLILKMFSMLLHPIHTGNGNEIQCQRRINWRQPLQITHNLFLHAYFLFREMESNPWFVLVFPS